MNIMLKNFYLGLEATNVTLSCCYLFTMPYNGLKAPHVRNIAKNCALQ